MFLGRSEIDFSSIVEDLPSSPQAEPPPLAPRGFIRSISLGAEDNGTNLAFQAAQGEETDLDALTEPTETEKDKKTKLKKKDKKPLPEPPTETASSNAGGLEKFPGEDEVLFQDGEVHEGRILNTHSPLPFS